MSTLTTFRLADPFGAHRVEIANYKSYDYTLNCSPGAVGVLDLELPRSFNTDLLLKDARIGPWRSIDGRPAYNDANAQYTIEVMKFRSTYTFIRAYHVTGLMERRIIAYAAGSSYAQKAAAPADNQLKAFWRENAGSLVSGANRDGGYTQPDISTYVTVQVDQGLGASVAKAAARRQLLAVARELAEASATAGTYMTFEISAPSEGVLELRTYTGQRGVDRRAGTTNQIILREQAGVLENAELEINYHDERTFVVAGGQGEGTARLIATQKDLVRANASPFGWSEAFLDMSNVNDLTYLQDDADAGVWYSRPLITFSGDLIESPALVRGIDFDLGDIVTAEDPQTRKQFDVRLDVVNETATEQGSQSKIVLRGVT